MAISTELSNIILDVNEICNVGHPIFEFLNPNPNIKSMFNEFNRLFFNNELEYCVDVEWMTFTDKDSKYAGQTFPPQANRRNGKIILNLNKELLGKRSRKEIIEILIHEMIHAYLIHTKREDIDDHHGINFVEKMSEINLKTGLNITVYHELLDLSKQKFYMWRCRGVCQYMPPYFGFNWITHENEPAAYDLMTIPSTKCEHQFEKYGNSPKDCLTEWECILIFNEFILENNIRIKTTKQQIVDFNVNLLPSKIANTFYTNFDHATTNFIKVHDYLNIYENDVHEEQTICMICLNTVTDENVIEHLNKCCGIKFSFDCDESLPIIKIV